MSFDFGSFNPIYPSAYYGTSLRNSLTAIAYSKGQEYVPSRTPYGNQQLNHPLSVQVRVLLNEPSPTHSHPIDRKCYKFHHLHIFLTCPSLSTPPT